MTLRIKQRKANDIKRHGHFLLCLLIGHDEVRIADHVGCYRCGGYLRSLKNP